MNRAFGQLRLIVPLLLLIGPAKASTFVGNGGNSSNLDLRLSLGTIEETMNSIGEEDINDICVCGEEFFYLNSCKVLQKLDSEQVKFCNQTLYEQRKTLARLSSSKSPIKFVWTNKPMTTDLRTDGAKRPAHAVSNREKMTITLNEDRFVQMTETQRISLLVHELLHFVKFSDGYPMDHEKLGPFSSTAEAFDACGAAVHSWAEETDTRSPNHSLNLLSRAYKKHWISFSIASARLHSSPNYGFIHDGRLSGVGMQYSYNARYVQPYLLFNTLQYYESYLMDELTIEHSAYQLASGLLLRIFPFDNPSSRLSQFHLQLGAGLQNDNHTFKVSDGTTVMTSKAHGMGSRISFGGEFPFYHDFWLNFSWSAVATDLRFKEIDTKLKSINQFNIGVSYAR